MMGLPLIELKKTMYGSKFFGGDGIGKIRN